jgi:hypothetical protein
VKSQNANEAGRKYEGTHQKQRCTEAHERRLLSIRVQTKSQSKLATKSSDATDLRRYFIIAPCQCVKPVYRSRRGPTPEIYGLPRASF